MGSSVQVVAVGGLLVGAFLFGRSVSLGPASTTEPENERTQIESLESVKPDGEPSQNSLRSKILKQRQQSRRPAQQAESSSQAESSTIAKTNASKTELDIVIPDFSRLENPGRAFNTDRPTESTFGDKVTPLTSPTIAAAKKVPEPKLDTTTLGELAGRSATAQQDKEFHRQQAPRALTDRVKSILMRPANPPSKGNEPRANELENLQPESKTAIAKKRKKRSSNLVPIRVRTSTDTGNAHQSLTYTTVFGDTLHSISSRFFGTPDYYLEIYIANKDRLRNPAELPTNIQLRIPTVDSIKERQ